MSVEPIQFISVGTTLQIKYRSSDGFEFYDGVVMDITEHGDNYITCQVLFNGLSEEKGASLQNIDDDNDDDNNTEYEEVTFYNSDFANDESDDTWKFKIGEISLIVSSLLTTNEKLKKVWCQSNINWFHVTSKLFLNFTVGAFVGLYTYKMAQNSNLV